MLEIAGGILIAAGVLFVIAALIDNAAQNGGKYRKPEPTENEKAVQEAWEDSQRRRREREQQKA